LVPVKRLPIITTSKMTKMRKKTNRTRKKSVLNQSYSYREQVSDFHLRQQNALFDNLGDNRKSQRTFANEGTNEVEVFTHSPEFPFSIEPSTCSIDEAYWIRSKSTLWKRDNQRESKFPSDTNPGTSSIPNFCNPNFTFDSINHATLFIKPDQPRFGNERSEMKLNPNSFESKPVSFEKHNLKLKQIKQQLDDREPGAEVMIISTEKQLEKEIAFLTQQTSSTITPEPGSEFEQRLLSIFTSTWN
jgi:hypothetical protein